MDNYSTTSSFDSFELQLNIDAQQHLKSAANWATFLCILGFIILGFGLLGSLAIIAGGAAAGNTAPFPIPFTLIGIGSVVFNVIAAIPVVLLFRFANSIKRAISEVNTELMASAFKSLKGHYMAVGIFVILSIIGYIVSMIYLFTIAASMGNHF